MSLAFANLRASAASLPPRMAVVLHSSDVFAIAKTRHQQIYSGCIFVDEVSAPHICKSILFSNYLFCRIFFLLWRTAAFCFFMVMRKQNAAPRFPLISFCLFCSIPAVLLLSSKTASALYRPRMDVVLCSNEFDISSNSLSSTVQGCTTLDRGYRFYRCPKRLYFEFLR